MPPPLHVHVDLEQEPDRTRVNLREQLLTVASIDAVDVVAGLPVIADDDIDAETRNERVERGVAHEERPFAASLQNSNCREYERNDFSM